MSIPDLQNGLGAFLLVHLTLLTNIQSPDGFSFKPLGPTQLGLWATVPTTGLARLGTISPLFFSYRRL
jgi:hypothetical protein